jgi:hypothetical protein
MRRVRLRLTSIGRIVQSSWEYTIKYRPSQHYYVGRARAQVINDPSQTRKQKKKYLGRWFHRESRVVNYVERGEKKLGRDKEERPKENKYKEVREYKENGSKKHFRNRSKASRNPTRPISTRNGRGRFIVAEHDPQNPAAEARFHQDEITNNARRQG